VSGTHLNITDFNFINRHIFYFGYAVILILVFFVRTLYFGMELYNDQLNAQFFNLFYLSIYFCLTCFGFSFSLSSEAGIQIRQWLKSIVYGVSARALTPYTGKLNM
jgi:hypothetical protein